MRGWQLKESISAFALLWGVATLSACGSPGELASAGGGAQADEVAAIEEKLEPAFEHIDELVLRRMNMRRHESTGRKRRMP